MKRYKDWNDILNDKTEIDGDCLIWTAGCHSQGYPMVRWDKKMVQVKRKQIEDKIGRKLDKTDRVKNTVCGNIKCVNPDHYTVYVKGQDEWHVSCRKYSREFRQMIRDEAKNSDKEWGYKERLCKKYNIHRNTLERMIQNDYKTEEFRLK